MRQLDYIAHLELYKIFNSQTLHVETKDLVCEGRDFDTDYDILEFDIRMIEPVLAKGDLSIKLKINVCDMNNEFIMYESTEIKPKWMKDIAKANFKVLVPKKEIKDED